MQGSHPASPMDACQVPAPQAEHATLPALAAYSPSGHALQLAVPDAAA